MPTEINFNQFKGLLGKLETDYQKSKLITVLYQRGYKIEEDKLQILAEEMEKQKYFICANNLWRKVMEKHREAGRYDSARKCAEKIKDTESIQFYGNLEALSSKI